MEFEIIEKGFILDKMWTPEDKTLTLPKEYLENFKKKFGKDFKASWLKPKKVLAAK